MQFLLHHPVVNSVPRPSYGAPHGVVIRLEAVRNAHLESFTGVSHFRRLHGLAIRYEEISMVQQRVRSEGFAPCVSELQQHISRKGASWNLQ